QPFGKQRKHGSAKADEHIGAKAGGPVLEFALQADHATENGRQHQAGERTANGAARHFPMKQIDEVLPIHILWGSLAHLHEAGFRWADFITGVVRRSVTCVITARADYRAR